jgi:hypothetical protein
LLLCLLSKHAKTIKDNNQQFADLAAKSWNELDKSGKLEDLKAKEFRFI